MPALCDVNWLVALCHRLHQHHGAAKAWFESPEGEDGVVVCRVSQLGMLRLLTNPAVMKDKVCTTDEAWNVYDRMMTDDRFAYRDEPGAIQHRLREFTRRFPFSPKLWQDAYLAAFAVEAGLRLVTFDRDFAKFKGLDLQLLTKG